MASAFFALWWVCALTGVDVRALCLDLGGDCSPAAAGPQGSCHDQDSGGAASSCGSCVDIVIHAEASAGVNRPDQDLQAPTSSAAHCAVGQAPFNPGEISTRPAASLAGGRAPRRSLRSAVLRI